MKTGPFESWVFSTTLCMLAGVFGQAVAEPIPFGDHSYELVTAPGGIAFSAAVSQSAGMSYLGTPGYLATINSAAEHAFLAATYSSSTDPVWIGPIYRIEEYPGGPKWWMWVNTAEPTSYLRWGPGEPNGIPPNGWVTVYMDMALPNGGTLNDRDPTTTSFGYIVEYNAVPEPSTWVLLAVSGLGLCLARKRLRKG